MRHRIYAETMAEAEAIIEYLENWCDNYSGSVTRHNLLVTWLDQSFEMFDWLQIFEMTLANLEGTPEYDEFADIYKEEIAYCKGEDVHIRMAMYKI